MSQFDHPFWRLQHAISYVLHATPLNLDALHLLIEAQKAVHAENYRPQRAIDTSVSFYRVVTRG